MTSRKIDEREAADDRILGSGSFVEEVWRVEGQQHRRVLHRSREEVLGEVSDHWQVGSEAILGRSRARRAALARRDFLAPASEEAGLSAARLSTMCRISHVSVRLALLKGLPPRE